MGGKPSTSGKAPIDGEMFLFKQPVLLSREQHGSMGLSRPERPFEFANDIRGVPITLSEVSSAQKHFPLVFTNVDNPTLIAVLGVLDNVNLFVTDDGQWDQNTYIPSYLRCYPFAFARGEDDKMMVVIAEVSPLISESPAIPFFDGEELSPKVRARVDISGKFEAERRQTQQFCEKLKQLGLLKSQQASVKMTGKDRDQVVAEYVSIDTRKFSNLDKDSLYELHQADYLYPIFGHVASLENWTWLMTLRINRQVEAKTAINT
ncbi:MAG: SapC family protein [Proteobacteria bacterium]|nr:SapC family protein [Pseudomonadota bacterium]